MRRCVGLRQGVGSRRQIGRHRLINIVRFALEAESTLSRAMIRRPPRFRGDRSYAEIHSSDPTQSERRE